MVRIERIVENRMFRKPSPPFYVFERRITEALMFEREVMLLKIGKRSHEYAKRQFIVFLISCFESYLQDVFTLMIDKGIIKVKDLLQVKRFKDMKFKLEDIEIIRKERIKISEIIANEINFQDFKEIIQLCSLIDFESHFEKFKSQVKKGKAKFVKKRSEEAINDFLQYFIKSRSKKFSNPRLGYKFYMTYIKHINCTPIHDLRKMYGTIIMGLKIRHKIVHQAADFQLPHEQFHLALLIALVQFCTVIQLIFSSPSRNKSSNNYSTLINHS